MNNLNNPQPTYTILAGSNGAGKSTFRRFFNINDLTIDADDIARNNNVSNMDAGRLAISQIKDLFKNKTSFVQETTLASPLLSNLELAKMQGYKIDLVYIAISSPEEALKNIQTRVKNGFHDIPEKTVYDRFPKTYKNLIELANKVDNITILDNSNKNYNLMLNVEDKKIIEKSQNIPTFLKDTIDKVCDNLNKPYDKQLLSVHKNDLKLLNDYKAKNPTINFKVNPYQLDANKITILASKDIAKSLEKVLENTMELSR